jgi:D-alanyl-D-alanine carboxypeptidase
MATRGKPPAKKPNSKSTSSAHDPLDKWGDDAEDIQIENVDTIKSFQETIAFITKTMAKPGINSDTRRAMYEALANAKRGLKEAKDNAREFTKIFRTRAGLKEEAQMKLKDVKELLKANRDPYAKKYAQVTQNLLNELIKDADKLGTSLEANERLATLLKNVQESTENLPEEFAKRLKETTELFDHVSEEQEKQHDKWTTDYKRAQGVLDARSKELKDWRAKLGMGIADKFGIGKFSVGGAIRGYQGASAFIKKRQELSAAKKLVQRLGPKISETGVGEGLKEDISAEKEVELVDLVKEYVSDSKSFNRKLLSGLGMKKKGTAPGEGGTSVVGAALSGAAGGAAAGAAAAAGGLLKSALTTGLSFLASGAGLASLAAIGVALAGKYRKESIEANPTAPEFKFDPYAMKVRGEASSVTQATKINQRRALKTLQPGAAREYLAAGPGIDGLYTDGYTKAQLEQMAKGTFKGDASVVNVVPKDYLPTGIPTGGEGPSSIPVAPTIGAAPISTPVDQPSVTPTAAATAATATAPTSGTTTGTSFPVSTGAQISKAATGSSISAAGGVDMAGLDPSVRSNLNAMADEYFSLTGKKLPINSAFRSKEKQAELYKTMPAGMAAAPGSSIHNYGMAFDTNSAVGNELGSMGLLSKYGFDRPIRKEPWHVQPAGLTLAAAKSGLFSADAPNNQGASTSAKAQPASQGITAAVSPMDVGTAGGPTTLASAGNKGSMGAPVQSGVKSITTFDSSDGMFLAMNMGMA